MKRNILWTLTLIAFLTVPFTPTLAKKGPVGGRIISGGEPVEYANVTVHTPDTTFVTGCISRPDGRFELPELPAGNYLLKVACMGYQTRYYPFSGSESAVSLGDIVLQESSIALQEVEVKASLIRREADRFVMDVANSPSSFGKDGEELLQQAPGVWMTDDKLSINGSSGTKVYINDRLLRLSGEQLIQYLRTLRSEDIQRIDIIVQTGAEYDADNRAGVIKIVLKRQREEGMSGNVSVNGRWNDDHSQYRSSGTIRYHHDKLTLNAGYSYRNEPNGKTYSQEMNLSGESNYYADLYMPSHEYMARGTMGAVYEFTPRHSIGLEVEYEQSKQHFDSHNNTTHEADGNTLRIATLTGQRQPNKNLSAVFNYIYRLDDEGSTLKLLADYSETRNKNHTDGHSEKWLNGAESDSLYYEHTESRYRVSTVTLALDKRLNEHLSFKLGAKYAHNRNENSADYAYRREAAWIPSEAYNFDLSYQENIAALYGTLSATWGRWSLVGGLRMEHTRTNGQGDYVKQSYTDFFPNLNISYAFDNASKYMLIGQYSRTISRPSFWALNPMRIQISEYSYQVGNPYLKSSYTDKLSATFVFAQKYMLSFTADLINDDIDQYVSTDPDNPNMACVRQENFDNLRQYAVNLYLPFEVTDWWSWQHNVTLMRMGDKLDKGTPQDFHNTFIYNTSASFTLPAGFYLDLSYRYCGKVKSGNFNVAPSQSADIKLKKHFCGEKLTVTMGVRNLFMRADRTDVETDTYVRHFNIRNVGSKVRFECGLTYNFSAGKTFKKRTIESGAGEERERMGR